MSREPETKTLTLAAHWTMRPQANRVLPILWTILLLLVLLLARPLPYGFLALGLVGGGIAGVLQRRSFALSAPQFFRATSEGDIREILRSRTPGKLYIVFYWLFSIFFVLLPMLRVTYLGFAALMGPLAARFAFNLVRDGATLPSVLAMTEAEQTQASTTPPI